MKCAAHSAPGAYTIARVVAPALALGALVCFEITEKEISVLWGGSRPI